MSLLYITTDVCHGWIYVTDIRIPGAAMDTGMNINTERGASGYITRVAPHQIGNINRVRATRGGGLARSSGGFDLI